MNYLLLLDRVFKMLVEHLVIHDVGCISIILRFFCFDWMIWNVRLRLKMSPIFLSNHRNNVKFVWWFLKVCEFRTILRNFISISKKFSEIELFVCGLWVLALLKIHIHFHVKGNECVHSLFKAFWQRFFWIIFAVRIVRAWCTVIIKFL